MRDIFIQRKAEKDKENDIQRRSWKFWTKLRRRILAHYETPLRPPNTVQDGDTSAQCPR